MPIAKPVSTPAASSRCAKPADLPVQASVAGEPPDTAPRKTLQHRVFQQSGGILSGDFLSAELTANNQHLDKLLRYRRRPLRWTRRHDADERRDHSRIEPIVLRQNPTRPCKLPKLERIDLVHGQASREQRTHDATLVAAARLQADRRDRAAAQPTQPARLLLTEERCSSDNTMTSRRSLETSIPQNESIFVSLPC